jgi:NitT/TauT family transport system ATP-binding protein
MGIEIAQLSVRYDTIAGDSILAVDRFDLSIPDGEFVAIVGPSGCGKSTLLRVLSGLMQRFDGSALVNGSPTGHPRTDVGVVFQDARLLPWLNVLENVLIPIRVQGKPRADYRTRARNLLATAGLEDFALVYPNELSGGMQQRVAICRALVHDPGTLLMDEPFGALDAMTREIMNLELLRIWGATGKTVVFVTHSIPEAVFLADRVVVMTSRPGRIQDIVKVDLPRPRDLGTMSTPAFGEFSGHVRSVLNAKGEFH